MRVESASLHRCGLLAGLLVACAAPISLADAIIVPENAPTIQAGIELAAAQNIDEIQVLPGTYAERIDLSGLSLTLTGVGGAGQTTIDATGLGGAAILIDGSASEVVIEGFTVTGGSSSGVDVNDATVTVRDSIIDGNSGGQGGGLSSFLGVITLENVTFSNNSAGSGGGVGVAGGSISATNLDFVENTASQFGAGLFVNHAEVNLSDLEFTDNGTSQPTDDGVGIIYFTFGGGAAYIKNADGLIANVRGTGNSAFAGGGIYFAGDGQLEVANVLFSENVAGLGVLYSNAASPVITNATVINNAETSGGNTFGVFTTFNAEPVVRNSIFKNNSSHGESGGNGITTFSNVIIDGPFFSAIDDGVIQIDPQLDSDGRPLPGSPVIDAGNNATVPAAVVTDLDGNPRFVDDPDTPDTGQGTAPIVDLGAFEFQPPVVANSGPDMDGSGCVDTNDLGMMLGSFGQTVPPNTGGDLTGDGVIDSTDLGIMLGWFGSGC